MPERRAPLASVQVDTDGLVAFTRALVRTPSVNDPAGGRSERAAADLVAERMRSFGWDPVVEEVAPGRPNVVAVVDGGRPGPTLLFEGHTDVVTEGDPAAWTHGPFAADVEDGRLYGRGAADMKGGLAAMLYAARAVQQAGPFPGRLVLAALADEEGMMLGAKAFVAAGHAAGVDAAIVCEPEAGEVCTTQKGAIRLRFDLQGRMAHGAMPEHGRNPLTAMARLVLVAEQVQRDLQQGREPHPHLGVSYLTPTVAAAGTLEQLNVIPAAGALAVDVRTVPGVDHVTLLERLRSEAQRVGSDTGVDVRMTVVDDRPPTETPADAPVVRALCAAHEVVTGRPAGFGGVPGTTDGTILVRDAGVPVVVYGPGGKWIAHQADEYVEVAEVVQAAQVYAGAALRFLHGAEEDA